MFGRVRYVDVMRADRFVGFLFPRLFLSRLLLSSFSFADSLWGERAARIRTYKVNRRIYWQVFGFAGRARACSHNVSHRERRNVCVCVFLCMAGHKAGYAGIQNVRHRANTSIPDGIQSGERA